MRYSIDPRDGIYVKGYGFLSFAKNLSNKYSQKFIDNARKKNDKRITDKITNISESLKELHSKEIHSTEEANNEIPKERYISSEKRQQIIDELRLV